VRAGNLVSRLLVLESPEAEVRFFGGLVGAFNPLADELLVSPLHVVRRFGLLEESELFFLEEEGFTELFDALFEIHSVTFDNLLLILVLFGVHFPQPGVPRHIFGEESCLLTEFALLGL
jgi:hypothetical protein